MKFKTFIGLEVHLQLNTRSKIFCSCPVRFGTSPNTQTCPVCLGLPGSLPVLNKEALKKAVKLCLALKCQISKEIRFDRKNYFYPDLPKGYQISQYSQPIGTNGRLKGIGIRRVHLEEDAGKLIHTSEGSLVDYNRAGIPLLEIVSEPEIATPQQAYEYLICLKSICEYIDISDCNMEEGSLRCDANISVAKEGEGLGTKVELKNMNSFHGVERALRYEQTRQEKVLRSGGEVVQETRLWDAQRQITLPMRSKEEANDYRYFPEPDLPIFFISDQMIEQIKEEMPELPEKRRERFKREYALPEYDADLLTREKEMADYFERCVELFPQPKTVSNWIMRDILSYLNAHKKEWKDLCLSPERFSELLRILERKEISINMGREVLTEMINTHKRAEEIIRERGLLQVSDEKKLAEVVERVIKANPRSVEDFSRGKEKALMFLVGQVMRETKGRANAQIVQKILRERIKRKEEGLS